MSAFQPDQQQDKEERDLKLTGVCLLWLGVFLGQEDCGTAM